MFRESPAQDETATKEPTSCIQPNPREETSQNSSGHPLDDLLGGAIMSDNMLDEFVDMTSSDPAFNSLFSLFNTDRDKFLNSERKKLSLSSSENDGKLNFPSSGIQCINSLLAKFDLWHRHSCSAHWA